MKLKTRLQILSQNAKSVATSPMMIPAAVMALGVTEMAHAGSGGTEFDEVWETVRGWTTGTLGRIIAGSMILVGIIGGIARQSLMAFAIGIAGGMGLNYAPDIVETVMSATLGKVDAIVPAITQISNGLGM